jgi:hypothetical protein
VALSANAATALIGGPGAANGAGSASVFTTPLAISTQPSLDFGAQTVDTTASALWLTVQNTGGAPLVFTGPAQVTGAHADDFTIPSGDDECDDLTLLPGQECQIGVLFTPATTSDETATLILGAGNVQPTDEPAVTLDGTGTSAPGVNTGPAAPASTTTSSANPPAQTTESEPLSAPTGTSTPSPLSGPPSPRSTTTCKLSERHEQITVRCALAHPPKGRHGLLVIVRRNSKVIASGIGPINGDVLTAVLHARASLGTGGHTTITLTTPKGSTTVRATVR